MLNPKQEAFCLEYIATANAPEAYRKAYGKVAESSLKGNSYRLLKNPKIQERLRELAEETKSAKIANAVEMQERLTAIIRQEAKEEVLMIEGLGEGQTQTVKHLKTASAKDIITAIDKLAKMQGAYNQDASLNVVVPVFVGEENLEE